MGNAFALAVLACALGVGYWAYTVYDQVEARLEAENARLRNELRAQHELTLKKADEARRLEARLAGR